MELYLDGHRIELKANSIAQTHQVNDLAELKNRQANFTNRFIAPPTPHNVAVMEWLGVPGNLSRMPYRKPAAKLVDEGIELISDGYAVVVGSNGGYEIKIYSGNISLHEELKGKRLNDLDYHDINHVVNLNTLEASFGNTTGYVHALADYGRMGSSYFVADYVPAAVYVHTLWDKIFKAADFTYSGVIFGKPVFLNKVVTPVRGYEVRTEPDIVTPLGSSNTNTIHIHEEMTGDGIELQEYFSFSGTPASMVNYGEHLEFQFNAICEIDLAGSLTVQNGWASMQCFLNEKYVGAIESGILTRTLSLNVKPGDRFTILLIVKGDPKPGPDFFGYTDVTASVQMGFRKITGGTLLEYNSLMPDKSQIDFIKDIMQRFGLMFRQRRNTKHYEFIEMQELLNDRAGAEDWSNKFISHTEDYTIGDYAQRNKLAYEYEEGVEPFADGYMDVYNETLKDEKTLFTSIFTASQSSKQLDDIDIYSVPLWERKEDNDNQVTYEPKDTAFRIFDVVRREGKVFFKTAIGSNVQTLEGVFPYLDFTPCHFQNSVDTFYPALNMVLDSAKKIKAQTLLDAVDIYNLDFFKLKYIEQLGCYFYLNRVSNYRKGKKTTVELIEARLLDINSPPTVVGDLTKSVNHAATHTFKWADFTFDTIPPFFDPDGDAAVSIRVLSLFDKADLKLNGVAISIGQEITKEDIVAGKLKATAHDLEYAYATHMTFAVKAENNDEFSIDTGKLTLDVAAPVNEPPAVNAGSNQTVIFPSNSVHLVGTATDPDGVQSTTWTKQSGGSATIATPSALETDVLSLEKGEYTFRLTAVDTLGAQSYDEVKVSVYDTLTSLSHNNPVVGPTTDYIVTIDGIPNSEVTIKSQMSAFGHGKVDGTSIGPNETQNSVHNLNSNGSCSFPCRVSADSGKMATLRLDITDLSVGVVGVGTITLEANNTGGGL